ncbi:MAG: M20/M25/M40 family metallo-hydrolase [Phycisphaerae bacterium]
MTSPIKRVRRISEVCLAIVVAAVLVGGCASDLERRFQAHIDYLASDRLEGRRVGSQGIELAAEYIAQQFAEIGLEPAGDDGTYFQTFDLTLERTLLDTGRLAWTGDAVDRKQGVDFVPFNFSSNEAFCGPAVFCGYGAVRSEEGHDDFVHLDLEGKVALMLRGEPSSWADEEGHPSRHAMFREKVYNAKDRGAVAVLIANQTPAPGQADELVEFESQGADAYGIPAFHIKRALADAMLSAAGLASLEELQATLDGGRYASAPLQGVEVSGMAAFQKRSAAARNVIGVLRGSGELADEAVVVGAHYDHLGIRKPMGRRFKAGKLVAYKGGPKIHNGADDNASGTSGLIEVARMLACKPAPKRSVLFIAFTAEETGLQGSKHYLEHAAFVPDRTAAMLNMDMIGRMDPKSDELLVFGLRSGEGLAEIVKPAAAAVGLRVVPSTDSGGRSDHAPFVRQNIPSMHFFTGFNSDYHKPSDDSAKINAKAGAKVVATVADTAYALATRQARPKFVEVSGTDTPTATGTPSYRVVMGIAPGYVDDGKAGMAVDAVNPEGPADLAGIKAGDRIIRLNGKEVANIYDYMASTRNNNPGDTVEVVVLRNGKELTLEVTLAGAR